MSDLMTKSGDRLTSTATDAIEFARTERIIHNWIREYAPLVVQMRFTPEMVRSLAARLTGVVVHDPGDEEVPYHRSDWFNYRP